MRTAEQAAEAARTRTMVIYAVVIQCIMLTATGTWGNFAATLGRYREQLLGAGNALQLGALQEKLGSQSLVSLIAALGEQLQQLPTLSEAYEYALPQAVLLAACSAVVLGAKFALQAARHRIPEEGIRFSGKQAATVAAGGQPDGIDSKDASSAAKQD
ncbi:hypothetical protein T492DRAFT_936900 [Pavlovales sp. CCMP2436]|nr:hypothetical protein T492DRAFT_936900 [Pavlovales sp. CCMP2436]